MICRKEKETIWFWIMPMRLPVVFKPSVRRKKAMRKMKVWGRWRISFSARRTCFQPMVA